MTNNIIFSICSFFYIVLICLIYFSKKRIKNIENKIYSTLIITNLLGIIIEISGSFLSNYIDNSLFKIISLRLINVYFLTWLSIFTYYVFIISFDIKKIKEQFTNINKSILCFYLFMLILVLFLPLNIQTKEGQIIYTYGPSVMFLYGISFVYIIICFFLMLFNIKRLGNKKYMPLITFFILGIITAIIQINYPALIILSSMETFITVMMFHTIENPDVKMIQQLELATEQAEKANRAKTDFLSSMSHEIRTPLNAIVGFSDCIMEANDLGEAKENAKDIVSASETLLEIVNGILDISKIEAGKLEIVTSPYNSLELFEELAKLITPKMKEKGLDFTFNIAADLPKTLNGDHANIKKVITNLLSNACKYTDRGYVHYEVNCINSKNVSKLIISVEDSGRGIKKENIDKMFTKFQRLDEDRNTTIEGTGLGLAITKQLIELMGGRIIVHTVYGQGSKFTVVLNQKIEKEEVLEKHHLRTNLDLHNIRILLVDDTNLNLKVATKLLEKYNANQIVTCNSGFECIERINRGEIYDLILLDDMMPKMSGVDTLKNLKTNPNFKTPTIALTANAITGMKEKYLKEGFDGYLAKPIEKEELIQVVNQVLGRNITEELDFSKEEKINNYMNGPVNPAIRGEEVINVSDNEKIEQERKKNDIIPVEDNVEELLKEELNQKYNPTEVELNPTPIVVDHINEAKESKEESKIDLVPVVDISPELETKKEDINYDEKYLEKMGVDINHALELLGDMEMYNMTINDFYQEVEDKWNRIVKYKNDNNMPDYAIEVHSLKSDCKYLGFMTLADIAYQHELKSKENDSEFVNNNFKTLEDEYNKVLEVVKNYVNK